MLFWLIALTINNVRAQEIPIDLKFNETADLINNRLSLYSEKSNLTRIIAMENGSITVTNNRKQTLKFNLFDLKDENNHDDNGIEIIPCNRSEHVTIAWINFKSVGGTIGFIRLDCTTPYKELIFLRHAFIQLKAKSSKLLVVPNLPYEALYFVSRSTNFTTENIILLKSIIAVDTIRNDEVVKSYGEGWLDKDSLPIGKWNFYAKKQEGEEYLFKTGLYQKTKMETFSVKGIDSLTLKKQYQLSFKDLQQRHLQSVPFIKSKAWNFYDPTGKHLKTVYYKTMGIPINVSIVVMDMDKMEDSKLTIELKVDKMDEWPEHGGPN